VTSNINNEVKELARHLVKLGNGDLVLGLIETVFATAPAASKYDACFQKWSNMTKKLSSCFGRLNPFFFNFLWKLFL